MPSVKTTRLERLFLEAKRLRQAGQELTASYLRKQFKLTAYGASCLFFMIESDEYCSELEPLYRRREVPTLLEKDESKDRFIKFLEAMPPYRKDESVCDGLSETDKDTYLKLGIARIASFEEQRQTLIGLYVAISRSLDQYRLDVLEAIAHNDLDFIREQFATLSPAEVEERVNRMKFKKSQLKALLEMHEAVLRRAA